MQRKRINQLMVVISEGWDNGGPFTCLFLVLKKIMMVTQRSGMGGEEEAQETQDTCTHTAESRRASRS